MLSIRVFYFFFFLPSLIFSFRNNLFFLSRLSSTSTFIIPHYMFKKFDSLNFIVFYQGLVQKQLFALFRTLFLPFFVKFIYKGKSYRIRLFKKKTKFTFNLGYSHWTKLYYNCLNIFFLKKQRVKFFSLTYKSTLYFSLLKLIKKLKKPNYYTLRGVRLKQQVLYRRFRKF